MVRVNGGAYVKPEPIEEDELQLGNVEADLVMRLDGDDIKPMPSTSNAPPPKVVVISSTRRSQQKRAEEDIKVDVNAPKKPTLANRPRNEDEDLSSEFTGTIVEDRRTVHRDNKDLSVAALVFLVGNALERVGGVASSNDITRTIRDEVGVETSERLTDAFTKAFSEAPFLRRLPARRCRKTDQLELLKDAYEQFKQANGRLNRDTCIRYVRTQCTVVRRKCRHSNRFPANGGDGSDGDGDHEPPPKTEAELTAENAKLRAKIKDLENELAQMPLLPFQDLYFSPTVGLLEVKMVHKSAVRQLSGTTQLARVVISAGKVAPAVGARLLDTSATTKWSDPAWTNERKSVRVEILEEETSAVD